MLANCMQEGGPSAGAGVSLITRLISRFAVGFLVSGNFVITECHLSLQETKQELKERWSHLSGCSYMLELPGEGPHPDPVAGQWTKDRRGFTWNILQCAGQCLCRALDGGSREDWPCGSSVCCLCLNPSLSADQQYEFSYSVFLEASFLHLLNRIVTNM